METARNHLKRIRLWIPLAAWIVFIFGISSIPSLSTEEVGLPRGFDKIAHFIEYFVLALLFRRGLSGTDEKKEAPVVLLILATGLLIGVMDEMYQSLIPGRHSSIFDFSADAAGLLVGTIIGKRFIKLSARGHQET